MRWLQVLACYAAAVALNSVLPANLGTLVMLLMFTTIIVAATFAGVLAGMAVQKIFFTFDRNVLLPVSIPDRRRVVLTPAGRDRDTAPAGTLASARDARSGCW